MAEGDRVNRRVGRLSKTRMEAFSDGVFAIAVTLLVLDLAATSSATARTLTTSTSPA